VNNMTSKDIVIKVENISKRYRIGLKEKLQENFAGALFEFIKGPLKNYRKYRSLYRFDDPSPHPESNSDADPSDIIWALRDVSFQLERGEVLGIIGKNGAGKSTLLKILSKITPPTSGRAELRGRVSSLLEIGTGFHPELTGRENIYLNGTILGMTKKEVDLKLDEIVDFSGVEKFIDTPVKRYSSGMTVRLAFSVAAHMEPEILIVDEVLAVGDAEFQKKSLGKMGQVAKEGRTVLFVSHNMQMIVRLCGRAILLEGGLVKFTGSPSDVVASYLGPNQETRCVWTHSSTQSSATTVQVKFKSARLLCENNTPIAVVKYGKESAVEITYEILEPVRGLIILLRLTDSSGNILWTSWDTDTTNLEGSVRNPGLYVSKCKIPGSLIRPGYYRLSIAAMREWMDPEFHENVLSFDVSEVGYPLNLSRLGIITPLFEWEVKQIG